MPQIFQVGLTKLLAGKSGFSVESDQKMNKQINFLKTPMESIGYAQTATVTQSNTLSP